MRLVKAAIPVVVLLLALAGTGVWLYTDSLGLSGADATDAAGEEKTQESQARDQRREVAVSSSAEPENGPRVSTRTPSAQRETPTRRPRRRKEPSTPRSARKKAPPPAPSAGAASGESGPPEATKPRQDLLPLMVQSVQDGQYEKALDIYSRLESHQALSRRGLIYRLRALASLNDQQRLQAFFEGHSIPDGEYYLRKCEYLTGKGAWAKAIEAARAASHTPSEYLSEDHIERQSIYYIALCRTGIHAVKATEESRKAALDSWFNVKFAYRNRQEHLHFAEANRHIRHLIQDGKSSE
jgi:hypothetical protein